MTPEEAVHTAKHVFLERGQDITSIQELPDSYIISGTRFGLPAYGMPPVRVYKDTGLCTDFNLPDKDNFGLLKMAVELPLPGSEMRLSKDLSLFIRNQYDLGFKSTPHFISDPVIITDKDGKCCLGMFVIYYTAEDLKAKTVSRPTKWITADIISGRIIDHYDTKKHEFSEAVYDEKISIFCDRYKKATMEKYAVGSALRDKMYDRLDETRRSYIRTGSVDKTAYHKYREMLCISSVEGFWHFYNELEKTDICIDC